MWLFACLTTSAAIKPAAVTGIVIQRCCCLTLGDVFDPATVVVDERRCSFFTDAPVTDNDR
jgi:hypothetical protein